jgi:hypothetical protein
VGGMKVITALEHGLSELTSEKSNSDFENLDIWIKSLSIKWHYCITAIA